MKMLMGIAAFSHRDAPYTQYVLTSAGRFPSGFGTCVRNPAGTASRGNALALVRADAIRTNRFLPLHAAPWGYESRTMKKPPNFCVS